MKKINSNKGIGESHGKLILVGEHSVIYNQPAIIIPLLSLKTIVKINPSKQGQKIISRYFSGRISQMPSKMNGLQQLIYYLISNLNLKKIHFEIIIESQLPMESGLGSSAAVAVATTRAFFDFAGLTPNEYIINKVSSISEKIIHGNPSGIDVIATSTSQPLLFTKQKTKFLKISRSGILVIANSGDKGHTKVAVNKVKKLINTHPKDTKKLIKKLGNLSLKTEVLLKNGDLNQLGQVLNESQKNLKKLNVSTSFLNKLTTIANDNGALGAKLTGSGLGGCIVALTPNRKSAEKVANALFKAGATKTYFQAL